MESKPKTKFRSLILLLIGLPTGIMVAAIIYGKYLALHPLPSPAPPPFQQAIIDKWKSQVFTSLQGDVNLTEIVSQFNYSIKSPLGAEESEQLTNALVNFVASYQHGTFDSMTRWRTPIKQFSFPTSISNAMVTKCSIPAATVSNNPEQAWKIWWKYALADEFKNYWVGISLPNCEVQIDQATSFTNNLMTVLKNSQSENIGLSSQEPSVLFNDTPLRIINAEGHVKVATVRILPKSQADAIYPVYYRMYWSPENKKWLPEDFVAMYARSDRKHSYFF